jgi:hypothetical protein
MCLQVAQSLPSKRLQPLLPRCDRSDAKKKCGLTGSYLAQKGWCCELQIGNEIQTASKLKWAPNEGVLQPNGRTDRA